MTNEHQIEKIRANILNRIARRRRLETKIQLITSGSIALGSIFGGVVALQYTIQELYLSNFVRYLSLIATDSGALLTYSKEFILSLTESLPLLGITTLLLAILTLLSSVRFAVKNIRPIYLSA